MTTKDVRRAAVQRIIEDRFHGVVADFARKISRSPAQVWQFMNDRGIGEKLARDIEAHLELQPGALDSEEPATPEVLGVLGPDEAQAIKKLRDALPQWRRFVLGLATFDRAQQDAFLKAIQQSMERPAHVPSVIREERMGKPIPGARAITRKSKKTPPP